MNPPRALALGIFGAALILIVSACGLLTRPTPGMARLVYFGPGNVSPGDNYAALRDDLRQAGWLEGQNFTFDWRVQADTTGIEAWMPELEAEIAQGRPVVVTTDSTAHALALKKATGRVSIVVGIGDPLASGVVTNDAHPGANITGVATSRYPQPSKKIEVLKEALPTVTHLGVLYAESTNPNLAPSLAEFEIATRQLGLEMASVQARRREDFENALEILDRGHADAVYFVQDVLTSSYVGELAALATRHRLPTMCSRPDWVQLGCLMSYSAQRSATHALRVNYIDKILRGARPGDLPIQVPTSFDLSINVKTLQALGLTIPPSVQPLVTEWIQ